MLLAFFLSFFLCSLTAIMSTPTQDNTTTTTSTITTTSKHPCLFGLEKQQMLVRFLCANTLSEDMPFTFPMCTNWEDTLTASGPPVEEWTPSDEEVKEAKKMSSNDVYAWLTTKGQLGMFRLHVAAFLGNPQNRDRSAGGIRFLCSQITDRKVADDPQAMVVVPLGREGWRELDANTPRGEQPLDDETGNPLEVMIISGHHRAQALAIKFALEPQLVKPTWTCHVIKPDYWAMLSSAQQLQLMTTLNSNTNATPTKAADSERSQLLGLIDRFRSQSQSQSQSPTLSVSALIESTNLGLLGYPRV
ncbi:hypothetical protein D9758_019045 [Tetrapyrgos nigripes]|uniref:Uncharacterized protein n=1 Tax=Tetrapyrgos nigripes TaxID=182062 RepID=A0A8H5B0Q3_9AGAR|nr:hypothetical protein D9758_019045 [Tetrapyrgos nigripes]